jgi:hypothetical protein
MKTTHLNLHRLPSVSIVLPASCLSQLQHAAVSAHSKLKNEAPSHYLQSFSARNQPNRRKWLVLAVIGAVLSNLGYKKRICLPSGTQSRHPLKN